MALIGGEAVPFHCLGVILRHATSEQIHAAEVVLSRGVALLSGKAVPLRCLGIVLRNTNTLLIHIAEDELSRGVTLIGKRSILPQGGGIIPTHNGGSPALKVCPCRSGERKYHYDCEREIPNHLAFIASIL